VKKAILKSDGVKGGFVRSTIAPVGGKPAPTFCAIDAVMVAALVLGLVVAMRFLVGN